MLLGQRARPRRPPARWALTPRRLGGSSGSGSAGAGSGSASAGLGGLRLGFGSASAASRRLGSALRRRLGSASAASAAGGSSAPALQAPALARPRRLRLGLVCGRRLGLGGRPEARPCLVAPLLQQRREAVGEITRKCLQQAWRTAASERRSRRRTGPAGPPRREGRRARSLRRRRGAECRAVRPSRRAADAARPKSRSTFATAATSSRTKAIAVGPSRRESSHGPVGVSGRRGARGCS